MDWNKQLVDENLELLGPTVVGDELGFSWDSCWLCRRNLGGNRHALLYRDEGDVHHESICDDCLMYVAYGDIPEDD